MLNSKYMKLEKELIGEVWQTSQIHENMLIGSRIQILKILLFKKRLIDGLFGPQPDIPDAAIDKVFKLGLIDRAAFTQFNVLVIDDNIQNAIDRDGLAFFHV